MSLSQWNSRYEGGPLPWDVGTPDPHLVELLPTFSGVRRVLEIGCGTGTNAVWMASQGLEVTALDLAPLAVERARERARGAGVDVRFLQADILADRIDGSFDLVYDRGCFHVFDAAADRARFAAQVAAHLAEGGRWLSVIGSTEGPARDTGPPRRSLRDLAEAVEPSLAIAEVRSVIFSDLQVSAWRMVAELRTVPAQSSTRRG